MSEPKPPSPALLERAFAAIERLKARVVELERERSEPLAIIGMGCRYPAGADDPQALWAALLEGRDGVRDVMAERWGQRGTSLPPAVRWAALLDEVDTFDANFFGIAPREARAMDPQHRLLLEVACDALGDAGVALDSLAESAAGVFVGLCANDYQLLARDAGSRDVYSLTGNLASTAAGRISFCLGLQGPAITLDTACSSSLVAVHLACRSLRARETDLALAGGVNLILSEDTMRLGGELEALSPSGRCRSFDAGADGFVRGEGCGVVVLARLSDALAAGHRIWAVIRGSAVNQDGRSTGLTTPNVLAQRALLRQALAQAGVEASQIDYVEAHGTGTALGDPIELEALRAELGAPRDDGSRCLLGAVKTNLGHGEASAGVAGLIKTALALHHERIPGNLHFRALNPRIDLAGSALDVVRESTPWPRSERPRIAGVSAFGLSGTNAHVIVAEAPAPSLAASTSVSTSSPTPSPIPESAEAPTLIAISARDPLALRELVAAHRRALEPGASLADVALARLAAASCRRRAHEPHRAAFVARSLEELRGELDRFSSAPAPAPAPALPRAPTRLAFVVSGHGSQSPAMARELLEHAPAFAEALHACDRAMRPYMGERGPLRLLADPSDAWLEQVEQVQPTLVAIAIALAAQWRALGVEPSAIVGHSMGEPAAAYIAGVLDLDTAARVTCLRSALMARVQGQGATAVIGLDAEALADAIRAQQLPVEIAAVNSPRSTVVSGAIEAIDRLADHLEVRGISCRRVRTRVAFHSRALDPLADELGRALARAGIDARKGKLPIYSTVTGDRLAGREFTGAHWARNLREPVRFSAAIDAMRRDGVGAFIELSPHPILLAAIEDHDREGRGALLCLPSLRRDRPERLSMHRSLAALYAHGHPIAWERLFPGTVAHVALPAYPWQRRRHWCVGELAAGWRRWAEAEAEAEAATARSWFVIPPDHAGAGTRGAEGQREPGVDAEAVIAALRERGDGCVLLHPRELDDRSGRFELSLELQPEIEDLIDLRGWTASAAALDPAQLDWMRGAAAKLGRRLRTWGIVRGPIPAERAQAGDASPCIELAAAPTPGEAERVAALLRAAAGREAAPHLALRGLEVWSAGPIAPGRAAASVSDTSLAALRALDLPRRRAALERVVDLELARVLGHGGGETLPGDVELGALGLDSIMGLQLLTSLGRHLGAPLPAAILAQRPTRGALVDELLTRIDADHDHRPTRHPALLELRGTGSRPPLFCIHPVHGLALGFRGLADHLADDQPVYGLQAPGVDDDGEPCERIEDLRDRYLEAVRSVQARGPVHLVGWSFGGLVAYDMACTLRAQGREVGLLAVLDLPAPIEGELAAFLIEQYRGFGIPVDPSWRSWPRARLLDELAEALVTLSGLPEGLTRTERQRRVYRAHLGALLDYRPDPRRRPSALALLRATGLREGAEASAAQGLDDYGWSRLVDGPVVTGPTPGHHFNLLFEPNVAALARSLSALLAAGSGQGDSAKPD